MSRALEKPGIARVSARMRTAPKSVGTAHRGLTNSLDFGKEVAAMNSSPALIPAISRFMSKVAFTDSCWVWTSTISGREAHNGGGYGQFYFERHSHMAHRWIYEQLIGPIADGLQIDHLCRNQRCVNPAHLEAVTPQENVRRGTSPIADQMKQTHCQDGHEFTEANTYHAPDGSRKCKECRRVRDRERYRSNPERHNLLRNARRLSHENSAPDRESEGA